MNEELQKEAEATMAEGYFKKYKKQMQTLETSLVSKATNINEHHLVQLGKQLDQWEVYKQICEANGSLNTLGELPKVALTTMTRAA